MTSFYLDYLCTLQSQLQWHLKASKENTEGKKFWHFLKCSPLADSVFLQLKILFMQAGIGKT